MMENMTLKQIAKACGGSYHGSAEAASQCVSAVVTDSRQVTKGALFIALRGERADGHSFIRQTCDAGAAAAVCEEEQPGLPMPYILVQSCTQALADIARYYRSTLQIPVIGVAGSVGKTSTKEMIASVLGVRYHVLKTAGNFNNEIGMPLTLLRIRPEHEAAVIEMGISDFGEMHRLARTARPDICVMTNIGECHLEFLGDRDGVLRAKSEMFDYLTPQGHIVLNGNDDKLSTIGTVRGIVPQRYYIEEESEPGTGPDGKDTAGGAPAALRVQNIVNAGLSGIRADFVFPDAVLRIEEPIPGIHNLYNAAAAALVGRLLGLTDVEIAEGIRNARTIDGRLHMLRLANGITVIDDCYNANPVSMQASLSVLACAAGRTIAVLGDMGELGADASKLHARVGAAAAAEGIDVLWCAGELSRDMAKGAQDTAKRCAHPMEIRHFETKEALQKQLPAFLRPGDAVLVKASHFMGYEQIVHTLKETFAQKADA